VRRLRVLTLGSIVILSGACGASTPDGSQPLPSSRSTFALRAADPAPGAGSGHVVVEAAGGAFRVFKTPSSLGAVRRYRAVNSWGQPLWLPRIGERIVSGDEWIKVLLPDRPNGATGWVRADAVIAGTVQDRIVVRLGRHTLTRYHAGQVVARFPVAVGKPSTPTTPGRFFVWARVGYQDVTGPYGNFALGLSGFSRVITDWPGGGRMAIHGTSSPNIAGLDVSNGCVRVSNPLMAKLIDVAMGAIVVIRR
jgi:L,D-transpeptidase catalytic domain